MRRNIYIIFLFVLLSANANAQYFPVFSQYVSNGLVLNPAYTGSREVLSINMLYRNQMVGFNGAPQYQTISAHAPLKNDNIGLGILLFNESAGPVRNTHLYTNYSYRIRMGKGKLSMGLKIGFNYGQYSWNNVYTNDNNDPAFNNNNNSFILPNAGAGVYYYSKKYFAGFSIPYFLSYKENEDHNGFSFYHDFKNYNFLITSGYLFSFSRGFKVNRLYY